MKNATFGLIMLFGILLQPAATYAQANANQQVADEIIGMVRAQWAAEGANPVNMTEAYKNVADDYTEFNPTFSTRIDGKAVNMNLTEANGKGVTRLGAEMLNPKVQVYGDVAILSYNFAGVNQGKDGIQKPFKAKSTRVYAKVGGKWKLVHGNFGYDPTAN